MSAPVTPETPQAVAPENFNASETDPDVLEAALYGTPTSTLVAPLADPPPIEPPAPVVAAPETPPVTPPASEVPLAVAPPVAPVVDTSAWPEDQRIAHEIQSRNPDLTPQETLDRAKAQIAARDNPPVAEPTTADQLAEIDAKLDEAGANEGLMTPEIVGLIKQRSDLSTKLALEQRDSNLRQQAINRQLETKRAESIERVVAEYGESVRDENSDIGKAISSVIEELQREGNPLLSKADGPELIFAIANSRLPAEKRLKSLSAPVTPETPPPGVPPVPPATPGLEPLAPPVPASGAQRSAEPVPVTPATVGKAFDSLSIEEQEAALYSKNGNRPNVLVRA